MNEDRAHFLHVHVPRYYEYFTATSENFKLLRANQAIATCNNRIQYRRCINHRNPHGHVLPYVKAVGCPRPRGFGCWRLDSLSPNELHCVLDCTPRSSSSSVRNASASHVRPRCLQRATLVCRAQGRNIVSRCAILSAASAGEGARAKHQCGKESPSPHSNPRSWVSRPRAPAVHRM